MSFLNKMLSKVGIGAAKIDAVLDTDVLIPGQEVSGVLNIEGGKVEQEINKIDLDIYSNYFIEEEYEEDEETYTRFVERSSKINSVIIEESFVIKEGEAKQIPFSFTLSPFAPLSYGKSNSWLKTNLDIDSALDKSDKDYVTIQPTNIQQALLDALSELGFQLVEAESEGCDGRLSPLPFVQEFEFKPTSGKFYGKLDELEMIMIPDDDAYNVYLEIDRKARGVSGFFSEMLGTDESNVCVAINSDDPQYVAEQLSAIIREFS
ncbi:sporulation protein [Pleionea sediminis]|uniref:sporulation protein n=1 Tax=Pleionea sediminis TaxID=2569479 RepID=UPI001186E39B|nr:sporulation protein [Pleionea sediminis]